MKDKVLNYLGLAARGRMLANGYNTCMFMMGKRKVKLLVLAEDLAENSMKKMVSLANKHNVPYVVYGTKEVLSQRTGNVDAGIFGVTDVNLAKAIKTTIAEAEEIEHRNS